MKNLLAFVFGGIFALGLIISGMSNPKKVVDFLDLFGHWDPSLAFVMMGAIVVAFIPFQKAVHSDAPKTLFNELMSLPNNSRIDKKLVFGGALFGIGWGIAGLCPAPSLTLLGLGHYEGLYFVVALLVGILVYRRFAGGH